VSERPASPIPSARRVLSLAFGVDVLDVATNLAVALLTGSAVVFAEMAQGLADSLGSLLLVVGERRSKRPPDAEHPFGYGREAFFWSLLSSVAMLVVGAGLSAWRAVDQLLHPEPLRHPGWALAVLALAVGTNGYTVVLSAGKLRAEHGSLAAAFRGAGRPLVKTALLRDAVGTLSALLGLLAIGCYVLADLAVLDALGALGVALLLAIFSGFLIGQARQLITGRALPEEDLARLRQAVLRAPEVTGLNRLAAVYAGAAEVLVELDLDLAEDLDTSAIEALLDRLLDEMRRAVPQVRALRVDLNSPAKGRPGTTRRRQARTLQPAP
jgi:cation diffusion facilitator family transporter